MLVSSIISLGVASVATCVSLNTKEEVVKIVTACTAVLAFLLTLIFVPWELKLLVIALPFLWERFRYNSSGN